MFESHESFYGSKQIISTWLGASCYNINHACKVIHFHTNVYFITPSKDFGIVIKNSVIQSQWCSCIFESMAFSFLGKH